MATDDHGARMDRIYRYQRRIYDPLRKLFLVGRDLLLERLLPRPGQKILEVGCGTARNLIVLHRREPRARLYGLDASRAMLETARAKLERRGLTEKIRLARGLAEELDPEPSFGSRAPFDAVFFSYSLTMAEDARAALDAAFSHLAPGGALYVVDFCDQAGLPPWLGRLIRAWLARYRVRFRKEMIEHLHRLDAQGAAALTFEPLLYRYAFFAELRKSS